MLLFLLALTVWLAYNMVLPFLDALMIADLAAIILNPVHQKLLTALHGRASLAAFASSLLLTSVAAVIVFLVSWRLIQEFQSTADAVLQWLNSEAFQGFMKKPVAVRMLTFANRYWAELQSLGPDPSTSSARLNEMAIQAATSVVKRVLSQGGYFVENAIRLMMNFLLMIIAFFFIIRDQEPLRKALFRLLPFTRGHEGAVSERIAMITRSTLMGMFLTAVAQGIGAAVGFWICGIPVLLGAVATMFASFVPLMGTGIVWLPTALYLLFTDRVGEAIALTVWWAVVVGFLLDNVLRSFLLGKSGQMSTPLVFFSLIGGIYFFGLMGIIYGPLVLGLLHLLLYLYEIKLAPDLRKPDFDEIIL